jgi:hypothetical protein
MSCAFALEQRRRDSLGRAISRRLVHDAVLDQKWDTVPAGLARRDARKRLEDIGPTVPNPLIDT